MFIVTQFLVVILNIIEAKLEKVIIGLKKPNVNDKAEHRWSAIYYVFLCFILTLLVKNWVLFPLLLINRRIFFQEGLNFFRKKGWFYLADHGMDKIQKNLLGSKAGVIGFIICVLSLIIINILALV